MNNYLIAVDMEGVHGVVGVPYQGLACELEDYKIAVASATREVNAVIKALYDGGADKVYVWDNHGNLDNLDFNFIDRRAKKVYPKSNNFDRIDFVDGLNIKAVLFIGYHSKEGSFNGVLAHTYDSTCVQYYKINGKQVGEFDIDSYIAGEYGVPPIFVASDDVCLGQVREHSPSTVTVLTKIGKGKRKAEFLDEETVLQQIEEGVGQAMKKKIPATKLTFPCQFEIRYSKMEMAEWKMEILSQQFEGLHYGEDGNTLCLTVHSIDALRGLFF